MASIFAVAGYSHKVANLLLNTYLKLQYSTRPVATGYPAKHCLDSISGCVLRNCIDGEIDVYAAKRQVHLHQC